MAVEHFRDSALSNSLSELFQPIAEMGKAGRIIRDLLRDKAFDSLRYMSKWIEAKNKDTDQES